MRTFVYIILEIFEPVVRVPCKLFSRLGVLFSLFLEYIWKAPNFPLVRMLGFFVFLGLVELLYLDILYYFKDTRRRII